MYGTRRLPTAWRAVTESQGEREADKRHKMKATQQLSWTACQGDLVLVAVWDVWRVLAAAKGALKVGLEVQARSPRTMPL